MRSGNSHSSTVAAEEDDAKLENHLPSEQDRKATLGCLAAVLNIMFASHERVDRVIDSMKSGVSSGGSSGSLKSQNDAGEKEVDAHHDDDISYEQDASDLDVTNFSIRQEDEDDGTSNKSSRWSSTAYKQQQQQQQRTIRRTKAFQKELLNISAELLFLSPEHAQVFLPNLDIQCSDQAMEQELLLQPFLQSLSNAAESFQCIVLLMFRFLLLSSEEKPTKKNEKKKNASELDKMTIVGYDARVRFAFKYLTVSILSYWEMKDHAEFMTSQSASAYATRKFEALEDGVALRLRILSQQMMNEDKTLAGEKKKQGSLSQNAIRGLKIGAAGIGQYVYLQKIYVDGYSTYIFFLIFFLFITAAGTVFAITGGLAAPAIVGGIAALTGASSAVTFVAAVLLLPAATTIFGVGGGTLVASKMSKRTAGLNEFDIVKVTTDSDDSGNDGNKKKNNSNENPELSRTVCISGWIKDEHDFERPFGVQPRALADHHELLCRFCSVYQPDVIPDCDDITKEWQGKEGELWDMLKSSYGKHPGSLLPIETGPRYDAELTKIENNAIDDLITLMGLPVVPQRDDQSSTKKVQGSANLPPTVNLLSDVLVSNKEDQAPQKAMSDTMLRSYKAWDFTAEYGSELYVITWETELLLALHGSVKDLQKDMAKAAAGEVLKKTAMASLMAAVFVPSVLVSLSNMIDEKWTLASERSDEAGILLAQSLLDSKAGHRPVSLIGFSFGARMIVACLKELARNQMLWEHQKEERELKDSNGGDSQMKASSFRKSISNMSMKQNEVVDFHREPASMIEDVIIMGCPASVNKATWLVCRGVVAGRIVNCYSSNDMILALMYRAKNLTSTLLNAPVGIRCVKEPGIENYDVSSLVSSHGEYSVAVREILHLVGYNQPTNARV